MFTLNSRNKKILKKFNLWSFFLFNSTYISFIYFFLQNVTRIASAPDPSRPWHGGPPPASSSEPQINLWSKQCSPLPPAQQAPTHDHRRNIHYHLACLFPEDQVQTVMQMYPDETNPQKICAAILSMFPKM